MCELVDYLGYALSEALQGAQWKTILDEVLQPDKGTQWAQVILCTVSLRRYLFA